jgi:hypothetical protein
MTKRIDTSANDEEAGIRFHISSARMSVDKVSFVSFQRFLDQMERSMFLCPDCGWRGRGRDLVPMETDGHDVYAFQQEAETWYACPRCEAEIPVDRPIMRKAE